MTTEIRSDSDSLMLHNFVQDSEHIWPKLPPCSILFDYVKTLEVELQKRRMVAGKALDSFNPLWFLAQTERDVFLWRHGYSITRHQDFEFWVDLPTLIKKREGQLAQSDFDNPFVNPDWGLIENIKVKDLSQETDYLRSLTAALEKINRHAHILSRMVSMVRREVEKDLKKQVVILPWQQPAQREELSEEIK